MCFFIITNKKQTPEFQISWAFLVLTIPIFAVILYLLFSKIGIPKSYIKKLKNHQYNFSTTNSVIEKTFDDYFGISNYLHATAKTHPKLNNKVEYFSTGESFYIDLLESLKTGLRTSLVG